MLRYLDNHCNKILFRGWIRIGVKPKHRIQVSRANSSAVPSHPKQQGIIPAITPVSNPFLSSTWVMVVTYILFNDFLSNDFRLKQGCESRSRKPMHTFCGSGSATLGLPSTILCRNGFKLKTTLKASMLQQCYKYLVARICSSVPNGSCYPLFLGSPDPKRYNIFRIRFQILPHLCIIMLLD